MSVGFFLPSLRRWSIVAALVALGGLGVWAAFDPRDGALDRSLPRPVAAEDHEPDRRVLAIAAVRSEAPVSARRASGLALTAAPRAEVVGPEPDDPHEPGMLPHPLDEAHERISTENALIQSLNDAMSLRNVDDMRQMLVEYRELDPNDVDALQLGYEIIADCIEFPGEASLTAAREFYATQRHSPLRRFVRRICFENSN